MRDIGKNIRTLREKAGLTQEALAEQLFVTRQTVSNYENGRTRPDLDMLLAIADVLHGEVTDLLYGIPTPPDRKRLLRGLVTGSVISLALISLVVILTPTALERFRRQYDMALLQTLRLLAAPAGFLALGWTLMQLAIVLGVKPPRKSWCRAVRNCLLANLVLFAVIVLPFFGWQLWCSWHVWRFGEVQSSFPMIPVYQQLLLWAVQITRAYTTTCFACLPYGAAIHYFWDSH